MPRGCKVGDHSSVASATKRKRVESPPSDRQSRATAQLDAPPDVDPPREAQELYFSACGSTPVNRGPVYVRRRERTVERFEGRIWVWRYRSERRSAAWYIHMMADAQGWDEVIRTILQLRTAPMGGRRTFPARELRITHDPTGFHDSYIWFAKFRVEVTPGNETLKQMHLSFEGDTASLVVTSAFAGELIETFQSVREGGWDFGFGPETRRSSPYGVGEQDRASLSLMFWQPIRGTV